MAQIIGLTGLIGAGKSAASAAFTRLGVPVADADGISRALTGPGGLGSAAVAEAFGPEFIQPDGAMDRARMRARVFSDPQALARLESVLHPLIGAELDRTFERLSREHSLIIYDCPLLWRENFRRPAISRILVIDACDETRLRRILSRPGIDLPTAKRMMAAQPSRRTLIDLADDIIVNESDLQALSGCITDFYNFLSARST